MIELHLITVVWGKEFTKTFLDIALPSQLSEGNIPVLDKKCIPIYYIYTRSEDYPTILSSPHYQKLMTEVQITFRFFEVNQNEPVHQTLKNCHVASIKEANQKKAAILFLSPDLIISRGFFHYLADLLNQGKRLIAGLGVRLSLEKVEKELQMKNLLQEGTALSLNATELTQLALKNLHSYSLNLFWKNDKGNILFQHLYWTLDPSMILVRAFHIHPFVIWPTNCSAIPSKSIDGTYVGNACPDKKDWHVITDTNEVAFFELSSDNRFANLPTYKPSITTMSIWASSKKNVGSIHRFYITHKFYIGTSQRSLDWDDIEKESDQVVDLILQPSWKKMIIIYPLKFFVQMGLFFIYLIKILFCINTPRRKLIINNVLKIILPKKIMLQLKKMQQIPF